MTNHNAHPVTPPQYPQPQPVVPANPAKNAGIALLACALFLAVGLFTKGWATAGEGRTEINAGLFGFEACEGGECRDADWSEGADRLDIPGDVGTFRTLGILSGLAGLGILIAAGVMALGRNTHKIPVRGFEIALAVPAFCLTTFAFRLAMADRDVNFGPSYSPFLAIGSLLVAGFVLRKVVKPLAEQLAMMAHPQPAMAGAQPMMQYPQPAMQYAQPMMQQAAQPMMQQVTQAGPQPACPTCGAAVQLAADQRRWCGRCQHYVG